MNHANEDSQHTTHGDAALAVQMPEGGHHDGRRTEITKEAPRNPVTSRSPLHTVWERQREV
jgi:hypothetical protein